MPDLTDRLTRESELATALEREFRQQKRKVVRAPNRLRIDWEEFQAGVQAVLAKNLSLTYGVASSNMLKTQAQDADEELALLLFLLGDDGLVGDVRRGVQNLKKVPPVVSQWGDGVGGIISSDLVVRSQQEVAKARQKARDSAANVETAEEAVRRENAAFEDLVEPLFGKKRAETIAATETTRAVSEGEGAGRMIIETLTGRLLESIWVTEVEKFGTDPPVGPPPPYGVCPICLPFHRKFEPEWSTQFPSGPPAHPNCRCFLDWRVISGPPYA